MQLKKKSNSVLHPTTGVEEINIQIEMASPPAGVQSQNALTFTWRKRQRVPLALQSVLREKHSERKSEQEQSQQEGVKKSKIGSVIRSGIRSAVNNIKDIHLCQICEGEIKKVGQKGLEEFVCDCEHKYNFCESCLHHYVIYKVNTFEEVFCPHEGCPQLLDINTYFFKSLPIDIQKNYKKLHQFYVTSKDPNAQLCPKEQCEGVIRMTSENTMTCDRCLNAFCSKCLLSVHQGDCDNQEIKFFEENLRYRQCQKCKFVVQKNQGCNHITCRCGFQFCYVCGNKWTSPHYGAHDQNGNLLQPGEPNPLEDGTACCDCQCMNEICGDTLASICKLPIKLFLFLLLIPLMAFIWVSRDLLVIIGMFVISILAGMFGFSFELLSEAEGAWCCLGVLFFPVTMIIGVGVGFREVFCDVVPDVCNQFWDIFCNASHGICEI